MNTTIRDKTYKMSANLLNNKFKIQVHKECFSNNIFLDCSVIMKEIHFILVIKCKPKTKKIKLKTTVYTKRCEKYYILSFHFGFLLKSYIFFTFLFIKYESF